MPVANYEQYCEMLEKAREGRYAYPAVNVTSTSTANAAIKAFADAKSDGIIQVSTGGGKFASGQGVGDMALERLAWPNMFILLQKNTISLWPPHGPLPPSIHRLLPYSTN